MAKRHSRKRPRRDKSALTVHCHCECPYWGKAHDHIWQCQCRCGTVETVCGYCLEAGRTTCCFRCAAEKN